MITAVVLMSMIWLLMQQDFYLLPSGGRDITTPTETQAATPITQRIADITSRLMYTLAGHNFISLSAYYE